MKITKNKQKPIIALRNLIKTHQDMGWTLTLRNLIKTHQDTKKKKKTINNSWGSKITHKPRNKPTNNSKSKLGKMANHEKQTLGSQHHAHSGSNMFTSTSNKSGDLCGGMLRWMVWWRFGQEEAEKGKGRKQRKPEIFA